MLIDNDISTLNKTIIKEKETIIGEFCFKFQLIEALDISVNENIILIYAKNISIIEPFIYYDLVKYEDCKSFGNLFNYCENIEEVYEFLHNLIENKKIEIKEIVRGKSINLSIKIPFPYLNKTLSADIQLLMKNFSNEEII